MCHALKGGPLAHEMTRVDPWDDPGTIYNPDTTHGTAIYGYVDPQNHLNVDMAYMESLGNEST